MAIQVLSFGGVSAVADHIEEAYQEYYKSKGYKAAVTRDYWSPEAITPDCPHLAESDRLRGLYNSCFNDPSQIAMLRKLSGHFCVRVDSKDGSKTDIITRIFNKSLLEDIVSEANSPQYIQMFVIESHANSVGPNFFQGWIDYRDEHVRKKTEEQIRGLVQFCSPKLPTLLPPLTDSLWSDPFYPAPTSVLGAPASPFEVRGRGLGCPDYPTLSMLNGKKYHL